MSPPRKSIEIHFESDWHIGAGAGIPGQIDRQVLKDEDGLPWVPGKTLTGILRDGAEFVSNHDTNSIRAEEWLGYEKPLQDDNIENGNRDDSIENENRGAKLSIRPAQLSSALRAKLLAQPQYIDALYTVKPNMAVDEDTGAAKEDHLFFLERVRGGMTLQAPVSLENAGTKEAEIEAAFLRASKAVRRIGGKRRRGSGKCSLKIVDPDAAKPANHINCSGSSAALVEGDWAYVSVTLRTELPVIVTECVQGNIVRSYDFIPGTLLLPYVCKRLGAQLQNVGPLIQRGELVVETFTPEIDGQRSLPVPLCLAVEKSSPGTEKTVYNRLYAIPDAIGQLQPLRSGWISPPTEPSVSYFDGNALLTQQTHNTIYNMEQRPTEDVGGVFTYEAIRKDLVFHGILRIRKESIVGLADDWWAALRGTTTTGLSSKDDYGLIQVTAKPADKAPEAGGPSESNVVRVYLLSDLLVRDEGLQYSGNPDDLRRELSQRLSIEIRFNESSQWGRSRRVDSWHARWRYPRPSLVTIQAGSVFEFAIVGDEKVTDEALRTLERDGLGERRAEGFGRVLLNPTWLKQGRITSCKRTMPVRSVTPIETRELTGSEKDWLRNVKVGYWREEILRKARLMAVTKPSQIKGAKEKSQWGALYEAFLSIDDQGDIAPALRWLGLPEDKLKAQNVSFRPGIISFETNAEPDSWTQRRRNAWKKSRLDFFRDLLVKADKIWTELEVSPEVELRAELWGYSVRTYVACLCERVFDENVD